MLELAVRPEDLLHKLLMPLVKLAVVQLIDGRFGARPLTFFELAQDPIAGVAQDLDLDRHTPQALANERILEQRHAVAIERAAHLGEAAQVGLMAGNARQDTAAALEAERRLRQLPALAFLADDVLGRHPNVVEEHFGELAVAGDLLEGSHLDAE